MLISTYVCVQDELNKGALNIVTVINASDSDYWQSEDERSLSTKEKTIQNPIIV